MEKSQQWEWCIGNIVEKREARKEDESEIRSNGVNPDIKAMGDLTMTFYIINSPKDINEKGL